jgi:hypothetical protein
LVKGGQVAHPLALHRAQAPEVVPMVCDPGTQKTLVQPLSRSARNSVPSCPECCVSLVPSTVGTGLSGSRRGSRAASRTTGSMSKWDLERMVGAAAAIEADTGCATSKPSPFLRDVRDTEVEAEPRQVVQQIRFRCRVRSISAYKRSIRELACVQFSSSIVPSTTSSSS